MKSINVLFTGQSDSSIRTLEAYVRSLENFDVKVAFAEQTENYQWPLKLASEFADIIIINLGDDFDSIIKKIPLSNSNKTVIVFGPVNNMAIVRQAMKMGAEDYLSFPIENEELLNIFNQHKSQILKTKGRDSNQIISVIGSRGGSGASFLSTNVAHVCAEKNKLQTALIDFDIQYGVQAMNLDIEPEHYLKEIVSSIRQLDAVAMKGYFSKHESGIYFLGESSNGMSIADEYEMENIELMLERCTEVFDETIIDLSHQIDSVFTAVVEKTNQFVLVCQQSIVHLRDTKRIYNILINEFGVPKSHIAIVVNRYNDKFSLKLDDIKDALKTDQIYPLANDFKRVSMSLDAAIPINKNAENAIVSKQIAQLVKTLRNEEEESSSIFKRAISGIFR